MSVPGPVEVRVLPSGSQAALLECPDAAAARRWAGTLRATPPPGAQDLVAAETTVLVVLRAEVVAGRDPVRLVREHLDRLDPIGAEEAHADPGDPREVTLEVDYTGPDLPTLADALGLTPDGLVRAHTTEVWEVAFGGFAPGFGYLVPTGGVWNHDVARHDSPRPRVPDGAVGVAGRYAGVYPRSSPGGWMLLGRTDAALFDPGRDPAALLRPGVRVRFVARRGAP